MEKTMSNIFLVVLIFALLSFLVSYFVLVEESRVRKKVQTILAVVGLVLFICVLGEVTLIGREVFYPRKAWVIPLYSYYKFLTGWQTFLYRQDLQNILMFAPMGFYGSVLLRKVSGKHRHVILVMSGFILSFSVEVLQYMNAIGVFETDDIIHNVLGVMIGCILYGILCCLRIVKGGKLFFEIKEEKKSSFKKMMRAMLVFVGVQLCILFVAYIVHMYYVHIVWS